MLCTVRDVTYTPSVVERSRRRPLRTGGLPVVVAAGLLIFMAQLDVTIVQVALPSIEAGFGASTALSQWVVLAYLVPLIGLSLLGGRWLDAIGQRDALRVSVVGFAAASVAAGLAPGMGWLIAARTVQGAFAALLLAVAPTAAVKAVDEAARGRALAVVSTVAPLGAITGPALGGALVESFGWSWIFYVNVPVAIAVLALSAGRLATGEGPRRPEPAWLGEAALLATATVALLVPLSLATARDYRWAVLAVIAPLPVLAWRRTATSRPVRRLLGAPAMAAPHVALLVAYAAVLLVQFVTPFFLTRVVEASPRTIGLTMLAFPAASAVLGPIGGLLSDRRGGRGPAVAGAAIATAGLALLAPLGDGWRPVDVAWRLALVGAGFGLFVTPVQAAAMAAAPPELLGTTASTTNLARHLGIALGPAIATGAWALSGFTSNGLRVAVAAAAVLAALAVLVSARLRASRGGSAPRPDRHATLRRREAAPTERNTVMTLKVAVIYYSGTGNVHALAKAVAEGAEEAGAEVRLRRVAELAPDEAIDSNPAWRANVEATRDVPVATHDDLQWADAYAFGTPTRFGNVAAQLKQFLDTTGPLWFNGELADKAATGFTSAMNPHGGNESTLLALYNTLYHWGSIVVPTGYTDQTIYGAGGNPYGTAHPSGAGGPQDAVLAAARYQGRRLVRVGSAVLAARAAA